MPIAALLLDECSEVNDYFKGIKEGVIKMESYLLPQKQKKVLLVVVYPIMYVLELAIFNGIYRWLVCKGLKKKGYRCSIEPITRMELVRKLIK